MTREEMVDEFLSLYVPAHTEQARQALGTMLDVLESRAECKGIADTTDKFVDGYKAKAKATRDFAAEAVALNVECERIWTAEDELRETGR